MTDAVTLLRRAEKLAPELSDALVSTFPEMHHICFLITPPGPTGSYATLIRSSSDDKTIVAFLREQADMIERGMTAPPGQLGRGSTN